MRNQGGTRIDGKRSNVVHADRQEDPVLESAILRRQAQGRVLRGGGLLLRERGLSGALGAAGLLPGPPHPQRREGVHHDPDGAASEPTPSRHGGRGRRGGDPIRRAITRLLLGRRPVHPRGRADRVGGAGDLLVSGHAARRARAHGREDRDLPRAQAGRPGYRSRPEGARVPDDLPRGPQGVQHVSERRSEPRDARGFPIPRQGVPVQGPGLPLRLRRGRGRGLRRKAGR
mmetsp:Transcript_15013/g.34812  ORF Transcript_15013/g.34812 Transcript_15013/m.34812 type:complete len:230 (+) Transcript_15013:276-965(+)